MSDFDDIYGGRFLAATDVPKPVTTTIEKIEQELFEQPGKPARKKAVAYFRNGKKPMVVNKTNAVSLASAYGKDFDAWIGRRVIVRAEATVFAGKAAQGLRIHPAPNGSDRVANGLIRPPEPPQHTQVPDISEDDWPA